MFLRPINKNSWHFQRSLQIYNISTLFNKLSMIIIFAWSHDLQIVLLCTPFIDGKIWISRNIMLLKLISLIGLYRRKPLKLDLRFSNKNYEYTSMRAWSPCKSSIFQQKTDEIAHRKIIEDPIESIVNPPDKPLSYEFFAAKRAVILEGLLAGDVFAWLDFCPSLSFRDRFSSLH